MNEVKEAFIVMLIGAGWPEKRVRELLDDLKRSDPDQSMKRYRALRRGLSKIGGERLKGGSLKAAEIDKALKMLRSAGPYSEGELAAMLMSLAGQPDPPAKQMSKGGLGPLLDSLASERGVDAMLKMVTSLRNELVHNPLPGWSLKDVR